MHPYDMHVHTCFSYDTAKDLSTDINRIAETAIERGLKEIAFTDHCDIDSILDGILPPYPLDEIKSAVGKAKEKYADSLVILHGVELGQPHSRPEEAADLIEAGDYDFVLGSLHNLRFCPDFWLWKYERMEKAHLQSIVRRSIGELGEIARFPGISSIAHITYFMRYMNESGVELDLTPFYDEFRELFRTMIANGVALELNISGLRTAYEIRQPDGSVITKQGNLMPDVPLLELYRACGGKLITVGSDAHRADDVGAHFEEARNLLLSLGFTEQTVFRNKKPQQIKL